MANKIAIGKLGEDEASKYLKSKGYTLIQRNYRTRYGEIDIIAKDGKYIVFVEVKTRSSTYFGFPREAVDKYKQSRIKNVSILYLAQKKLINSNIRFDVVEVILDENKNVKSVLLIKDAFE